MPSMILNFVYSKQVCITSIVSGVCNKGGEIISKIQIQKNYIHYFTSHRQKELVMCMYKITQSYRYVRSSIRVHFIIQKFAMCCLFSEFAYTIVDYNRQKFNILFRASEQYNDNNKKSSQNFFSYFFCVRTKKFISKLFSPANICQNVVRIFWEQYKLISK